MSREVVRNAFSQAIKDVYSGPVYVSRKTDNRNDSSYISVFIEEGTITHNFSGRQTEAMVTVRYCKKEPASDSELDQIIDPIITSLLSHAAILSAVKRPLLDRFEYEPDGTHNGINHTFKVYY